MLVTFQSDGSRTYSGFECLYRSKSTFRHFISINHCLNPIWSSVFPILNPIQVRGAVYHNVFTMFYRFLLDCASLVCDLASSRLIKLSDF